MKLMHVLSELQIDVSVCSRLYLVAETSFKKKDYCSNERYKNTRTYNNNSNNNKNNNNKITSLFQEKSVHGKKLCLLLSHGYTLASPEFRGTRYLSGRYHPLAFNSFERKQTNKQKNTITTLAIAQF